MNARDRDTVDPGLAMIHQELMRSLGLPQAPRLLTDAELTARLRDPSPPKENTRG